MYAVVMLCGLMVGLWFSGLCLCYDLLSVMPCVCWLLL